MGGVEYIVEVVSFEKGANPGFVLQVHPALPFDFTLRVGSTNLESSSATATVYNDGVGFYKWDGTTNPNWTDRQVVDVELDVPLIDICGHSPAVAAAIVEATPSFDFCHITSQLDLAGITELDLTGKSGYGLKAGDFAGLSGLTRLDLSGYALSGLRPQLPPGVFDGLHNLETLDINDTHLMSLSRGIFEDLSNLIELDLNNTLLQSDSVPVGAFDGLYSLEILRIADGGYEDGGINLRDQDIFRGLDNLRVLDVRPSKQLQAAPLSFLPLTSLTTYNGEDYTRPVDAPKNLTATMEDFPGDSSRKKVTLTWEAPDGVSGITGCRILPTHRGQPSDDLYAHPIASVGSNTLTYVHGASDGIPPESPNGFNCTYYVVAITADGDGFPAQVFVP